VCRPHVDLPGAGEPLASRSNLRAILREPRQNLPFASCKELLIDLFVETRGLVVYSAMGKHIGDVFVVEEVIDAETDLRLVEHLALVWRV
jgi:hypothetical protein